MLWSAADPTTASCTLRSAEQRWKLTNMGSWVMSGSSAPPSYTLAYAPPEVLTGKPVVCAYDMWSMGMLMFEVMTGAADGTAEVQPKSPVHPHATGPCASGMTLQGQGQGLCMHMVVASPAVGPSVSVCGIARSDRQPDANGLHMRRRALLWQALQKGDP